MSAQCVYVRDVSLVSPCALLMFGGDIDIQHQHQLISIDNFITLRVLLLLLNGQFLDPVGGSQKATLVLVLGISSLRVQKSLRLS